MKRVILVSAANICILLIVLCSLELFGQTIALLWPSYDVLFLQPDKALGWKQVPNLKWTWAGHYWYANEFSVNVNTNSLGFRDFDRPANDKGIRRVALIGDSYVEAVQVPFEKTGGSFLKENLILTRASVGKS
jgi:hypothetical protein